MTADLLREAAALIRRRAEAATSGPWEARHGSGYSWIALYADEDTIPEYESLPSFEPGGSATPSDATHIASWHPAVALKVARSLEQAAAIIDEADSGPLAMAMNAIAEPLVEVARAYLGGVR